MSLASTVSKWFKQECFETWTINCRKTLLFFFLSELFLHCIVKSISKKVILGIGSSGITTQQYFYKTVYNKEPISQLKLCVMTENLSDNSDFVLDYPQNKKINNLSYMSGVQYVSSQRSDVQFPISLNEVVFKLCWATNEKKGIRTEKKKEQTSVALISLWRVLLTSLPVIAISCFFF